MRGKAILKHWAAAAVLWVSKDAVPLAMYVALRSVTVPNQQGEAGKEVWARTSRLSHRMSKDICVGLVLALADKNVIHHPKRKD